MAWSRRIALATAVALVPALAGAWRAFNRHEVFPVSDTVFEVVSEVGSGAVDYWCGAGDYVRHALGYKATTRIYIWKAIGPSVNRPRRKAVQFALSPPKGASTTPGFSVSVKAVGDNMTAAMAYNYCLGQNELFPRWPLRR